MRWGTLAALVLALVPALAGCGGDGDTLTIYLKQRLGPDGPAGQISPVLMPVERERRERMSPERQAVLAVRQGPAPGEWGQGFVDTMPPETRLRSVRVRGETATVELAGREPDVYASAAIVYSLTELPGIHRVALRLDGRPCCVRTVDGDAVATVEPGDFAGWQGEPCALRTGEVPRCGGG